MRLLKNYLLWILFFMPIFSFEQQAEATTSIPDRVSLNGIFSTDVGVSGNSAALIDDVAIITNGLASQVGALWSTQENLLDFKQDFNMVSYVNQGDAAASSGDGLVFLLKSANNTSNWFTYSGASMGALGENKYQGALGLPNSIGVEFDLYGNKSSADGFFDNGITGTYNNNHIAVVYPGTLEGYTDNFNIFGSTRYVKHDSLITNVNLASGNWTRVELNWETNEQDYTKGILTFKINDQMPIQISSAHLNSQIFQNGVVSEAFWGFTGSTGPTYKADQRVIFERVPGLVNADTSIKMFDRAGQEILNQATVNGGSEVTIAIEAEWLGGKQNWTDIDLATVIPSGVVLLDDTTKVNGTAIDDSLVWEGNILTIKSGIIPDLGGHDSNTINKASITFKVRIINDTFQSQTITSRMVGRNAVYEATPFSFNTKNITIGAMINSHEDGEVILDNSIDSFIVEFGWNNENRVPLAHAIKLEQNGQFEMITEFEETATEINGSFTYNILEQFLQLPYGMFKLHYSITNQETGEVSSAVIVLYKQNAPTVTISPLENQSIFTIGEKIPLKVSISDYDSESIKLIGQLSDNQKIDFGTYQILQSEENNIELELDTSNVPIGKYDFKLWAVDTEGNESDFFALNDIYIQGKLSFASIPSSFNSDSIKIGGSDKKVEGMGPIIISDQRLLDREWKLQVNLVNSNFINKNNFIGQNHYAHDSFFYYKNNGEKFVISTNPIEILQSNEGTSDEYILNQDGENGFYFSPNNSMLSGTYGGIVKWSLLSTPI
ncbi:lectin-like domain-containing protein [Candidatus Enterococcus mansonii]|uniref:Legume lectin domain-containing protein n=1 Tax=Candidatus Enterococcus mansonii TaxID=1834181 RepID=A0A242CF16_9ENTE|nr:hypothetical protein [Enterococcus sp. 4G2_DIV0659]OTO08835.1 hypothetical protein A5880_001835 [Enterococcus sp. 4G2_DIV0659]